jgi:hypothetical protein
MKKSTAILLALLALITISNKVSAQDSTKTFTLSGSVDVYAHTTMGTTNVFGSWGPATSFGDLKGFGLGMANLIASYSGDKAGFTADLVFGPRGKAAVFYGDPSTGSVTGQRIINQLFAFYKLSDVVTLNMGQFNTFVGYEVISPAVNANYSTSYLFSNGPFNHTGIRADFSFPGGVVGKLAILNPTDMVEFNPVNTYTLGAQIGKTSDAGGVWLNFLYGDQDGKLDKNDPSMIDDGDGGFIPNSSLGSLFQTDLTLGYTISDNFYIGFNTSYQTIAAGQVFTGDDLGDSDADATSFFGVAVYPKIIFSETASLAFRGEYFSTAKAHPLASPINYDADGNGSMIALTATGNIKAGGLTILPEVRFDKGSEDNFWDKDGEMTDSMLSLTLAAVYKF